MNVIMPHWNSIFCKYFLLMLMHVYVLDTVTASISIHMSLSACIRSNYNKNRGCTSQKRSGYSIPTCYIWYDISSAWSRYSLHRERWQFFWFTLSSTGAQKIECHPDLLSQLMRYPRVEWVIRNCPDLIERF